MSDADTKVEGTPLVPQNLIDEWADVPLSLPSRADVQQQEEVVEPEDEKPEPIEEDVAQQVEYVADPGAYVPGDYSFEVTVYDEKGEKPKNHKINSLEDWDTLMEDDPNFGSGAALTKAMRLASKMEMSSEADKKAWEVKKADYDSVVQADTDRANTLSTWESEMDYLVSRGDMPAIDKSLKDANWSDPEVAKADGVKEQISLMKYMDKENKARAKAGLKQITSMLDAFNGWSRQQEKTSAVDTKKAEGEARRAAGARVASGSSAAAGISNVPKGVSVGSGGSLDDLGRGWF